MLHYREHLPLEVVHQLGQLGQLRALELMAAAGLELPCSVVMERVVMEACCRIRLTVGRSSVELDLPTGAPLSRGELEERARAWIAKIPELLTPESRGVALVRWADTPRNAMVRYQLEQNAAWLRSMVRAIAQERRSFGFLGKLPVPTLADGEKLSFPVRLHV